LTQSPAHNISLGMYYRATESSARINPRRYEKQNDLISCTGSVWRSRSMVNVQRPYQSRH